MHVFPNPVTYMFMYYVCAWLLIYTPSSTRYFFTFKEKDAVSEYFGADDTFT